MSSSTVLAFLMVATMIAMLLVFHDIVDRRIDDLEERMTTFETIRITAPPPLEGS